MSFNHLSDTLTRLQASHLRRQVVEVSGGNDVQLSVNNNVYLNFSSNDYLGLATESSVIEASVEAAHTHGIGSGGSSLVTGHSLLHQRLQDLICDITAQENCMLFSSGFAANSGVISALLGKDDLLIQDKLNHASLMEAGMQSAATMKRFHHNDMARLSQLLAMPTKQPNGSKLIVTEGVFSMGGDEGELSSIDHLARQSDSWLMVDDAHGFGINGNGRGSCAKANVLPNLLMATFGKAIGTSGAFVAANSEVIDFLINTCRHFIYSTALPMPVVAATIKSIELSQQTWRHDKLNERIDHFRARAQQAGLQLMPSSSAIQPIIVGASDKAIAMSDYLKSNGLWVSAIRPPTVPVNTARLRVTLSNNHQLSHIDTLVDNLAIAQEVAA
ncbi:aminotransferase class I/II-fold pyridoxal phosphate-dependent enzyme [Psychrobium sp. nBUS_13]|uniref:aminotransferase class I/II-fold pyridoxal phosphate-dependent enzyme n=1 Tax=Psychrobium sp. nBUS_13 TaxID=3395319 RepID=UPI003EBD9FFB